ncbi:MAG: DUF1957 domain-containing protein, partial [Armatimonadetes bacterium]|nr:DUF1957 domain-containing protein [Armatimonadota bacterium]
MADTAGSLALVLHAHLPYVRHPEWPHFFEEDWYFEACCETYIPLLNVMGGLSNDGVDWRLTMSLTPTLLSMCRDGLLQDRVRGYAEERRELADREVYRLRNEPDMQALAVMYRDHYEGCLGVLARCGSDLSREFDAFERAGHLEIVTCGATHGYFPLLGLPPQAVRAQVQVAVQLHQSVFGRAPRGIWLPECGYLPGHERYLHEAGLRYFFVEAHGVLFGCPRPRFGTYAPVVCDGAPVAAFGRDVESSKQVWSSKEGYPGDYWYREFYRDVGWDLDH